MITAHRLKGCKKYDLDNTKPGVGNLRSNTLLMLLPPGSTPSILTPGVNNKHHYHGKHLVCMAGLLGMELNIPF